MMKFVHYKWKRQEQNQDYKKIIHIKILNFLTSGHPGYSHLMYNPEYGLLSGFWNCWTTALTHLLRALSMAKRVENCFGVMVSAKVDAVPTR
jgi:hypothetical protein